MIVSRMNVSVPSRCRALTAALLVVFQHLVSRTRPTGKCSVFSARLGSTVDTKSFRENVRFSISMKE